VRNHQNPPDELALSPPPVPGDGLPSLTPAQRIAALRLARSENVGPVTFRQLITRFGSAEKALDELPGIARRSGRGRSYRIASRDLAEAELEAADRIGALPLFVMEVAYPQALRHDALPPPLIYVRGRLELLAPPAVAIVGSRNASAAGLKLTRMLAAGIGAAGFPIVSGLARGIDGAAHQASLASGTIGVVAGGLDIVYPPEHAHLHREIGESGCLVTTEPPGFEPRARDFPRRNRIIAGLSLVVVIVEAARRSGSLSTARMAAEQGREVLAVPGHPLDPRAEGTNGLIQRGATLVTSVDDVLAVLAPMVREPRPVMREEEPAGLRLNPVSEDVDPIADAGDRSRTAAGRVLEALGPAPSSLDDLARATELPVNTVRAVLLDLALGGQVEHHGAQLVSLKMPESPAF
jgi:DNA processing protein